MAHTDADADTSADLEGEIALMEFAEKAIFDIQKIFTSKLGGGYGTLKKAMEIEDFLYKDALYQVGEKSDNVWESLETLRFYKASIERMKKLMNERSDKDTDWVKLFNIKDVKNFRQQLTRAVHTQVKRKAPVENTNHSIPVPPAPGVPATRQPPGTKGTKTAKNIGKKQHKTKKAKSLETENRQREFLKEWEATFNAVDSSTAGTTASTTSATSPAGVRSSAPPAASAPVEEKKMPQKHKHKNHAQEEPEMPLITHLMHQDSTTSLPDQPLPEDSTENDLLFLDAHGEDSFFATAKLENASEWGISSVSHQNPAEDPQSSSTQSGWSTAINERKSQVEQTEAKQKHQAMQQESRRRLHEEACREVGSQSRTREEEEAAAAEEERRVAREREREKREREMQSQNVFMDGDHEALGGDMYW